MSHTSDTYEQTLTKKQPRSLANAEVAFYFVNNRN